MTNHEIYDIIAQSPASPLEDPNEAIAEQLVLLMHRGVDWNVWGGDRRYRYWDAMTDRVRAATYAGATLNDWWEALEKQIKSQPRNAQDRLLVASLLTQDKQDERLILSALRKHSSVLVMRIRVHIDAYKKSQGKGN